MQEVEFRKRQQITDVADKLMTAEIFSVDDRGVRFKVGPSSIKAKVIIYELTDAKAACGWAADGNDDIGIALSQAENCGRSNQLNFQMGMTLQQTHYAWRKKVATETLRRPDPHRSFESADAPADHFLG